MRGVERFKAVVNKTTPAPRIAPIFKLFLSHSAENSKFSARARQDFGALVQ